MWNAKKIIKFKLKKTFKTGQDKHINVSYGSEIKTADMTHAFFSWPLEPQFPPAHPPATHKMASTFCSPSNWATSDVTCTKWKMLDERFSTIQKIFF